MAKVTEGYMPFLDYETYYRVVGERKDNGKAPLICLHGGPGSTTRFSTISQMTMIVRLSCMTSLAAEIRI